jgi:hypothetical protein
MVYKKFKKSKLFLIKETLQWVKETKWNIKYFML